MNKITRELLEALPKSDLHLHLDGSLRPSTLIELARDRKVKLPAYSEAGLYKKVFKDQYTDLNDYLTGFAYTCAVLRDAESLERAAFELCVDCQNENVLYAEIRFAPQLHTHAGFEILDVLKAVTKGLRRAEKKYNARAAVKKGLEPPFRAGILVCAMRFFTGAFSDTFAAMCNSFSDLPPERLYGLASEALVKASVRARDFHDLPIVGLDLAGAEHGFPAKDHQAAYGLAHDAFLGKTVHAGEAFGPESIFQAITDCHADRIGHGTWLFSKKHIQDREILDKASYVEKLVQYVADRRLTLEVCLTSNMQTNPSLRSLKQHPFKHMVRERLSTTLCTDNRLISRTTVTDEWVKAVDAFGLSASDVRDQVVYGFKRSFFPGPYREKRAFVRAILDHRDRVFAEHGFTL
ncbi:MAG: adenosine deaminase family protein [Planctomycetes bacterium]|nr:adenosine deaminase family protein [Planctomycetota bacterium]MBT4028368.1 adenosine deaminase family protein [Planctomycetota bacterium]MBT4561032.1 adenosine deaminase family protein [Planctomycetota bacterium]MBT5101251.1 adenosine deaminase family protein [Planctomycetota bacterium]MBT5120103.1 adenosine deaminase family protein [Planctomycetota bacterium]